MALIFSGLIVSGEEVIKRVDRNGVVVADVSGEGWYPRQGGWRGRRGLGRRSRGRKAEVRTYWLGGVFPDRTRDDRRLPV